MKVLDENIRKLPQGMLVGKLDIELTARCNLRCPYCYATSGIPRKNEMSWDDIIYVITQAIKLGADNICVVGGGEPFMYAQIWHLLEYITKFGVKRSVVTNGTLLEKSDCQRLYGLGYKVIGKLNSFRSNIQDRLVGVEGAHKSIWRGIDNLLETGFASKDGPGLGLESVITSLNYDDIPEIWDWCRSNDIKPYFEMVTLQGQASKKHWLLVEPEQIKYLFEHLQAIDRQKYGFTWRIKPPMAAYGCDKHYYSCYVTSTGNVQPCPGVELEVGNIRKRPLQEILSNEVFKTLRKIDCLIEEPCASCEHNGVCYGCRGEVFIAGLNLNAADPTCWHVRALRKDLVI